MGRRVRYYWDERATGYDFGPQHPMKPYRLRAAYELVRDAGLLLAYEVAAPTPASEDELLLIHSQPYIDAVKALSLNPANVELAERFNLDPLETPAFANMHEVCALIAGGSLGAMRSVMHGEVEHAANFSGGLHHGHRASASGFCIYNDSAIAIAAAVEEFGARVAYFDFDAHHGDGVQEAFYDDPRVLTVSFHETGRYLFPGTGDVLELGKGAGAGYSLNLPLAPFTEDASWLECVQGLLPAVLERFRPDLIVGQFGCDSHVWDPLTHLALTTRAYEQAAQLTHLLAHSFCDGRMIALGGGGYDATGVVPRAWGLVWASIGGRETPKELPRSWLERWQPYSEEALPRAWRDQPEISPEIARRPEIERENREKLERLRSLALKPHLRRVYHAGGPARFTPDWAPPVSRYRQTSHGPVIFTDRAVPSLVSRLDAHPQLVSFARTPEREKQLLRTIAEDPESNLSLAHTPAGVIVAQVSIVPAEGRWADLPEVYEVGIEVARDWRAAGIGPQLLKFAFERKTIERMIVLALGLSWHWDLEGEGLSVGGYRDMLARLFATVGFHEERTDDPEINHAEGNILLVRAGSLVDHDVYEEFHSRLFGRASWFGFR